MVKIVEDFLGLLTHLDDNWDMLNDSIRDANGEQQDLLHEIELVNFNAFEGFALCKELKDLRMHRRILKDKHSTLSPLREFMLNGGSQATRIALHKTIIRMKDVVNNLETRTYFPRIRTDLKLIELQKKSKKKGA